ncbi:hypothetical protein THRCLA_02619 [Thraustotheca clavata]|uniref:BZIP domain-containing protein n=1 Tax=Thraustotheca clavata TaxID=74557 RepID=A0A1W0A4Q4_9STRA|nr:hypothetical protein THRCLA_02619 [Thraustotheca clavata]
MWRTEEERRAMRSRNQRKYMDKRKKHATSLESSVHALRQEVARLEGKRDVLHNMLMQSIVMNETHSLRLMGEYVRMFEHGFRASDETRYQESFLRSIMHEDMIFHGIHTLDTFIAIFQQYTSTHSNFTMRYLSCDVIKDEFDGHDISCTLKLLITQRMSRSSISTYYPHVLCNEALVQTLIGRTISIPQTSIFTFDQQGKIIQYDTQMAMIPSLLQLLGSLELTTFRKSVLLVTMPPSKRSKSSMFQSEEEKILHQRRLRASNQRAHVARRQQKIADLTKQVNALAYETNRLEGKKESLSATPWKSVYLNDHQAVKRVHEYLKMFRYGYQASLDNEALIQQRFLRSIMREDVQHFGLVGIDKFLHIFRVYCSSHSNFSMYFLHCDCIMDDESLVTCKVQMIVSQRITRNTLSMYFPHILHDEVLVQKLIGRQIDLPTTSVFGFDDKCLVETYNSSMDFVAAYKGLLEDLNEVATLVGEHKYHPKHLQRSLSQ